MLKQVRVWLEVLILFVFPIWLFYVGAFPDIYHYPGGLVIVLAVAGFAAYDNLSMKDLGFRLDNTKKALPMYTVIAVLSAFFIFAFAHLIGNPLKPQWWTILHFQGIFFLSSFIQEFMYRGFLIPRLKAVLSSPWTIIFVNTSLFLFLHIVCEGWMILPLSFVFGIAITAVYYYYPNLLLATIVHAIANFIAALYGFI